jgi:hypothetical protein
VYVIILIGSIVIQQRDTNKNTRAGLEKQKPRQLQNKLCVALEFFNQGTAVNNQSLCEKSRNKI